MERVYRTQRTGEKCIGQPNATPNEVSEILEKLNKFEFTYKDKESGEEDKKDPNPGTSGDSEQQGTSDTSHKKESVKTGDTTAIAVPVAGIGEQQYCCM